MIIQKQVRLVWQNPYVTKGLVAWWDAEWNIRGGDHAPDLPLADWHSILGRTVSPTIASPTIPDIYQLQPRAVVRPARSADVLLQFTVDGLTTHSTFTFDVCQRGAVASLAGFSTNNQFAGYGNATFRIQTADEKWDYYGGTGQYNTNSKDTYSSAITIDDLCIRGYSNGKLHRISVSPMDRGPIERPLLINLLGSKWVMTENSALHSLRIYNRILTPSEVAINHAADRERFGF